jgi:hypothetical protein
MAATPVVTGLTLIDADADQPLATAPALTDGAVLNLSTLPTTRLNVRADVGPDVGSVLFGYDGDARFALENGAPFALASNNGPDYLAWTPAIGTHTIAATPYSLTNAGGTAGAARVVTFTVVSDEEAGAAEDEPPPPAVAANLTIATTDADADEPGGTGTVVVTRDGPLDADLVVNLTVGGTATETSDYEAVSRTVTIPAGSASAAVQIRTLDDAIDEQSETVVLTLADGTGYAFDPAAGSAQVTIADDDDPTPPPPAIVTIKTTDPNANEPGGSGTIQITRDGPLDAPLDVNLTLGGTATEAEDFLALPRTVTIPTGSASVDVVIRVVDNTVPEFSETVVLTLAEGPGYTFSPSAASAQIAMGDNDTATPPATVTISTTDASSNEPTGTGAIRLTRTGSLTNALVVNFTVGGTATEASDYQTLARTVTIPAGSASATVTIRALDDLVVEPSETVVLTLAAGTGYTFSTSSASAQVTIGDNDGATPPTTVTIATSDPNSNEPTGTGSIRFTRSGSLTNPLVVNFTVGGTATEGSDYQSLPRTVTIPAGSASATVTIRTLDDLVVEPSETVVLTLAAGTGYTFSASSALAQVAMASDDVAAPFRVTAAKVGTTGLSLSWMAPAGEVVSYEITYVPGAYIVGAGGQPKKTTVSAPAGGVSLSGLASFTLYSIDVAAINAAGGRQTAHVNAWTGEPAALRRYLYVVDAPKDRTGFQSLKPQIQVFDVEAGHQWVKNIPLPRIFNIRGVAASAITDRLYISYHNSPVDNDAPGGLLCLNLNTGALIWRRDYAESVIPSPDRFDLSPDGKKVYMPIGESGSHNDWAVIDAGNGNITGWIEHVTSPHNTIFSLDGRYAFLEGQEKGPQPASIKHTIGVVDTATNQVVKTVGPFKAPVRPFTVNGKASLIFATVNYFIGFQVGDVETGRVLYTAAPPGRVQPTYDPAKPFMSFAHGISLTADEKEVWVVDQAKNGVHVWDVSNVPKAAPRYVKFIQLRRMGRNMAGAIDPAASNDVANAPAWLVPSYDGRYMYPEGGEIVDIASKTVVGQLRSKTTDASGNLVWAPYTHSRFILEVQFDAGLTVRATNQFGVGRVR